MDNMTREKAQEYAENEARKRAVEKGADEHTLEVIDVVEVPLAYLPGNAVRYYLRVVGDLLETNSHDKAQGLGLKQTWLILRRSTPISTKV